MEIYLVFLDRGFEGGLIRFEETTNRERAIALAATVDGLAVAVPVTVLADHRPPPGTER